MKDSQSTPEAARARGELLRKIRGEKGLTLKPAAELGDVSRSTIKNLEAGYTLDPGVSNIAMISRVYGLSTAETLGLFGIEVAEDNEAAERLEDLRDVATGVLVAIWRAVQNGALDERSVIADQALRLRDALNPDWPNSSEWLPIELQDNS